MMKKSIVIKANRLNLKNINKFKFDKVVIILSSVLICGLILGIFTSSRLLKSDNNVLCNLFDSFLFSCSKLSFINCFFTYLLISLLFVFFAFILGFCAVGTPALCLLPFVLGLIFGSSICCYFTNYGLTGFLFCILGNIPFYAITAATLLKCCCESMKMSVELFCVVINGRASKSCYSLRDIAMYYCVMCIPLLIGSIIKTIGMKLFIGFFGIV